MNRSDETWCVHNWGKSRPVAARKPTVEAIIRPHKFNFNCRMFGAVFLSLISHIVWATRDLQWTRHTMHAPEKRVEWNKNEIISIVFSNRKCVSLATVLNWSVLIDCATSLLLLVFLPCTEMTQQNRDDSEGENSSRAQYSERNLKRFLNINWKERRTEMEWNETYAINGSHKTDRTTRITSKRKTRKKFSTFTNRQHRWWYGWAPVDCSNCNSKWRPAICQSFNSLRRSLVCVLWHCQIESRHMSSPMWNCCLLWLKE